MSFSVQIGRLFGPFEDGREVGSHEITLNNTETIHRPLFGAAMAAKGADDATKKSTVD